MLTCNDLIGIRVVTIYFPCATMRKLLRMQMWRFVVMIVEFYGIFTQKLCGFQLCKGGGVDFCMSPVCFAWI